MGHFTPELREAEGGARELVVVVHGLKQMLLRDVPNEVRAQMPGADILLPLYNAQYLSNIDAIQLAAELSELIEQRCAEHAAAAGQNYERIILIGHSRGVLLLRKAYVLACGQHQELQFGGLEPKPKSWPLLVSRMLLLAGMNRGWSLTPKPPAMSWLKCLTLRCVDQAMRLIGAGKLMRSMKRGAPFVANLRVQWINLVRSGWPMPVTVQVLGNSDDIVAPGDNIDLQSGAGFIYLNAPDGTTHATVVDLSDPARRRVFVKALMTPAGELESDYRVPKRQQPDPSVEQVVFIMHGIRDFGGWVTRFRDTLRAAALPSGKRIETVTASYGYFPMLNFLLFSERQKNVRWFMDEYTEALARFPNASMEFAGHSNGTYLLAGALRRYAACSFHRAAFAGSVVPRNFPWDGMVDSGRISAIRNYVATGDWVVGIFPHLFEPFGDVGAAGLMGFTDDEARKSEVQFMVGGHSAAIVPENFESIAAFLLDGELRDPPKKIASSEQAGLVLLLSKLCWAVWIVLVGLIVAGAWWVAFVWSPAFVPNEWVRLAGFVLLLLALMGTI